VVLIIVVDDNNRSNDDNDNGVGSSRVSSGDGGTNSGGTNINVWNIYTVESKFMHFSAHISWSSGFLSTSLQLEFASLST